MKTRKQSVDVIEVISRFRLEILAKKPTLSEMRHEVLLMNFKVRPVRGDMSSIRLDDERFIEILWSLGKLDEFYRATIHEVDAKQRQVFNKLFDELYQNFHRELNALDLNRPQHPSHRSPFEIEIFREHHSKMN